MPRINLEESAFLGWFGVSGVLETELELAALVSGNAGVGITADVLLDALIIMCCNKRPAKFVTASRIQTYLV